MAETWHSMKPQEVLERLGSARDGLNDEEVRRRREEHGPNVLAAQRQASAARILVRQFRSIVILVLLAALVLAAAATQWPETIAIAAVILVNTFIGFFSEWRAIRSMEALRRIGQAEARIRRAGQEQVVPAPEIVPGDILLLGPGDTISADGRLLDVSGLRVEEASLTGESVPVSKGAEAVAEETPLAERTSMVYKGTAVGDGTAAAVVTATGAQTEVGRISKMAQEAEGASTPLQQRLDRLGKRMAVIVIITAAVVAGIGVLAGQPMILMIETAIALGVAAIPEGLPIVATIALARGMWLMARRNALINHLPAVETLGATTVIFTDKTGTLTENRMTAGRIVTSAGEFGGADAATAEEGNEVKDALDAGQQAADDALARRLLEVAVLCNKASLHQAEDRAATGDPMEIALLEAGEHAGLSRPELLERKEEVREEPFSRDVMMMATYHQTEDGLLVAVKGAPAAVLEACDRVAARGGEAEPLTDEAREQWSSNVQALAKRGLRLLAFADKQAGSTEDAPYDNLRLLGLVGLLDPPREDVRDAINLCQAAGVQVVMVTGDQPETAGAIAEAVGIVGDPGDPAARVMHGKDLRDPGSLNDEEKREVHASNIFARVTPEQKLNLIELYQERSEVVAMTGDGVNDAPALKKADIGVAMGQRGTEAAKQVADMVLKDDAFQSIVAAVEQGRVIFGNIRKSVMFMLCTNGAEVLAVAIASLAALPLPLRPLQILYLNVLTDVLPALALGVGTGSGKEMDRPPRPKSQSILTRRHWSAIGGSSALLGATVLAGLLLGMHWLGLQEFSAVTCSFLVLAFGKLWFVFNLRDPDAGALSNDVTRNPWIWGSIVVCAGLLLAAVYVPGLSDVLKTRAIGGEAWGLVLTLSLVPLVLGQLALAIYNLRRGRARRAATRQRERAAAAEA